MKKPYKLNLNHRLKAEKQIPGRSLAESWYGNFRISPSAYFSSDRRPFSSPTYLKKLSNYLRFNKPVSCRSSTSKQIPQSITHIKYVPQITEKAVILASHWKQWTSCLCSRFHACQRDEGCSYLINTKTNKWRNQKARDKTLHTKHYCNTSMLHPWIHAAFISMAICSWIGLPSSLSIHSRFEISIQDHACGSSGKEEEACSSPSPLGAGGIVMGAGGVAGVVNASSSNANSLQQQLHGRKYHTFKAVSCWYYLSVTKCTKVQ